MGLRFYRIAIIVMAGCSNQPAGGGGDTVLGDVNRISCTAHADCATGNPCTEGTCRAGFCEFKTEPDESRCDDGNACTEPTACRAGDCVGVAVDCTAFGDQCNKSLCDPSVGCMSRAKADDSSCYAGSPCTAGDSCQGGVCVAGPTKDCTSLDSDCTAGVCDTASGNCVTQPVRAGLGCDDGLFCTDNELCDAAGNCSGMPHDCSAAADDCNDGTCNESLAACEAIPARDGLSCDDGVPCTTTTCSAGTCSGGATDCSGLDTDCNLGGCDNASDTCVQTPTNEGGLCDDGRFCTITDTCQLGACVGTGAPVCTDIDSCTADLCDEGISACSHPALPRIPGAEGLAVAGTCGDSADNDCDGFTDAADRDCQPCSDQAGTGSPSADCDDGDPCTENLCTAANQCSVNLLTGATCDDGLSCTSGDACAAGICVGQTVTCSGLDDDCNVGSCSDTAGCFAAATNEGLVCDDGLACTANTTCAGGICAGKAVDCSSRDDDCNTGRCDEFAGGCVADPVLDGTTCTVDSCTSGSSCVGGICSGGAAIPCDDSDPCTADWCDPASGCLFDPAIIDNTSQVAATSVDPLNACLVAGSDARLVLWTDLRTATGAPITGAAVTIGGSAATESPNAAGIYWLEMLADTAPGSRVISVTATACSAPVTLLDTVAVTFADANAHAEGTGGCSPADGNVRVTVVDETGAPILGAGVMVGSAPGTLATAPEALFGGALGSVPSYGASDAAGVMSFYDYGGALNGPVAVTAGATGHAYFSIIGSGASDIILALPSLATPAPPQTLYTGTSMPNDMGFDVGCDLVEVGLVLPKLRFSDLFAFSFDHLLARNQCWDSGDALVGSVALPGNVWIPSQSINVSVVTCLIDLINEATWAVPLADGTSENLELVYGTAPADEVINILINKGELTAVLPFLDLETAGFVLNETVPTAPTTGVDMPRDSTYPNTFAVTFSGQPTETDILGLTLGDYADADGLGDLFMIGEGLTDFQAGNVIAIANSGLAGPTAPTGVGRLAMVTAFFLDATDTSRSFIIPNNRRGGSSTVFIRADAAGNDPFDASGGATGPTSFPYDVTDFLDLTGTTFAAPDSLKWEDATRNGFSPAFSRHELIVERSNYMPPLACELGTNQRVKAKRANWILVRPFGTDPSCGGDECFDLPALPQDPIFPRLPSGARKRSGFEQLVGSGSACTSSATCNTTIGEDCVATAAGVPSRCVGGSGTEADPYFREDYVWDLSVYRLGRLPSFDFNDFDFSTLHQYVTHESANEEWAFH